MALSLAPCGAAGADGRKNNRLFIKKRPGPFTAVIFYCSAIKKSIKWPCLSPLAGQPGQMAEKITVERRFSFI